MELLNFIGQLNLFPPKCAYFARKELFSFSLPFFIFILSSHPSFSIRFALWVVHFDILRNICINADGVLSSTKQGIPSLQTRPSTPTTYLFSLGSSTEWSNYGGR